MANKPLRIVMISTAYAPWLLGGAERSLQELSEELSASGNVVRVLALGPAESGISTDVLGGVDVVRFGSRAFKPFENGNVNASIIEKIRFHTGEMLRIRTLLFLRRELKKFEPDIVHFHNLAGMGWVAWLAASKFPTVQSLRDFYLLCLKTTAEHNGKSCTNTWAICWFRRLGFSISRPRPSAFIGVSDRMIEIHRTGGSVKSSESATTVYNRPAVIRVPPSARKGGARIFGLMGTISQEKGTWLAIEAFRKARDQSSILGLKLVIAGSGSKEQLERLSSICLIDTDILAIGTSPPDQFFSLVDVVLMPTQWEEPFGRVAAETLLAERILVASEVGGLPEVARLHGGRYSLIRDFRDSQEWSTAIQDLTVCLPTYREASVMRENTVASEFMTVYESVISERSLRSSSGKRKTKK